MKLKYAPLIILLLSSSVSAQWTGWTTINAVRISDASDLIYIKTSSAIINPASCTATDMYAVNAGSATKSEQLSLLLAASLSGKQVTFSIYDDHCTNNRPAIRQIEVNTN